MGQQYGEDSTTFLFFAQVSESANQLKAVGPQFFDMALLPRQIDHIWKRRSHDFGILENFTWRRCDLRKLSKAFSVSQRASSLGQAKSNEAVTSVRYASEKDPVLYFDLVLFLEQLFKAKLEKLEKLSGILMTPPPHR